MGSRTGGAVRRIGGERLDRNAAAARLALQPGALTLLGAARASLVIAIAVRPEPAHARASLAASQSVSRIAAARESSLAPPPARCASRVVNRSSYNSTGTS